jgi:hypothetical protein
MLLPAVGRQIYQQSIVFPLQFQEFNQIAQNSAYLGKITEPVEIQISLSFGA